MRDRIKSVFERFWAWFNREPCKHEHTHITADCDTDYLICDDEKRVIDFAHHDPEPPHSSRLYVRQHD